MVSGEDSQTISLSASISNDVFHPDKPLGNNGGGKVNPFLQQLFSSLHPNIIQPNGDSSNDIYWQAFARQSLADITLKQAGTYKISLNQKDTPLTTYLDAEGNPNRQFGAEPKLPAGASQIIRRTTAVNTLSFVSHNALTHKAFEASGEGLEIIPITHPNDLFAQEKTRFQLQLNGQPQANTSVHITRGGTRHRNSRNSLQQQTDQQGYFSIEFNHAGFYLVEAETTTEGAADSTIDFHHHTVYLTLEVFSQ